MAATYYYVDSTKSNGNDGSSWANAFSTSDFETSIENLGAGVTDVYYFIKGGTYSNWSASNIVPADRGTTALPCYIIGVKSGTTNVGANIVLSDYAYGTDRPLFSGGAYGIGGANTASWIVKNIILTTTGSTGLSIAGTKINCKATNTSTTANRPALYGGININCEGISIKGYAIQAPTVIVSSYLHDSAYGTGSAVKILNNVIETCVTGIELASTDNGFIVNNTIYNCITGINSSAGDSINDVFINNIISQCYDGISWYAGGAGVDELANQWHNNLLNNTDNEDLATKATSAITGNKELAVTTNPISSLIVKGTDGATDAGGTTFTAASAPFSGVTAQEDYLIIKEAGTGATLGVYYIGTVTNTSTIVLSTSAGANKSGITYGIVKGTNFKLTDPATNVCSKAGAQLTTNDGLATADFHLNIGVDQTQDFPDVGNVITDDTVDGVTGTFAVPAAGDVQQNVQYGTGGTDITGTFVVPAEEDVKKDTTYGYNNEYTGSLTGGSGGAKPWLGR